MGRALAELRQALVLAPKSPDVFAALGEAYEAAEQWAEAESAHASAVILAKESTPGQVNSYRAAAVRLAPQSTDLRMDLAALLARIGRREQAIEQYRLVLAHQPSHEAAHRALRSVGIAVLDAAPRP